MQKGIQRKEMELAVLHPNDGQVEGLPKNPRRIRDPKFKKLVQSIKDDPEMLDLRELIVYDTQDERGYVIIGGNMRYQALTKLKYETAPCKILPHDFPMDKMRRIVLKDNSSFGETDFDALLNDWNLEEIEAAAIDIPDIQEPEEEEEAKDDGYDVAANTPKKATSRTGDLYRLGNHRLICGDSTKGEYLDALMGEEQADLLVTDPPYNVDYQAKGKMKIANDHMADENFVAFLTDTLQNASDSMKPGAAFYIWHADSQGFNFRTAVKNIGWETRQCLIWNKNSLVLGRQDYQWKHEPCLYGWKDGAAHYFTDKRNLTTVIEQKLDIEKLSKAEMKDLLTQIFGGDTPTSVIDCDKPKKNPDHPTMKPVPLIGKLINNSSRRKDIVLDIFGGSGTTLIAAEQLGRCCRMVEFEPIYVDVIIKRWEEMTGMKAVLIRNILDPEQPAGKPATKTKERKEG
jgi:site-specific DNA-methyltransferase (adenine-specific)